MNILKRKRFSRLVISKPVGIVLLVVALLIFKGVWNVYQKSLAAEENLYEAKTAYDEVRERRDDLSANLARLKSEEGLEEILRERYGVVREGEKTIVLVRDEENSAPEEEKPRKGFWNTLYSWFD